MKLGRCLGRAMACLLTLLVLAAVPLRAEPTGSSRDAAQRAFALPQPSLQSLERVRLWATYYYAYRARREVGGIRFRDREGRPLSDPVDPRDWCLGAAQGTVRAPRRGSMVTLSLVGTGPAPTLDCSTMVRGLHEGPWIQELGRSYFRRAIGRFGDGVNDYRLRPFRTIAVDPTVIPFGTVLYVPEARGVEVEVAPGISVRHDGYFFAADEGPDIKGPHIDVYCGALSQNCFPAFVRSSDAGSFDAYIVRDDLIEEYLQRAHGKRHRRRHD